MAIELPNEVAQLLQFIGINWPQVNEDKVREAGQHVTAFGQNVQSAHADATATLQQAGQHYQGNAYEAMIATWGQKSQDHMHELITACQVVGTALDAAADVIIGMKVAAIAELVVLAASFIADQAAAVATFGIAEAAVALIEELAEKVVEFLEQQLIQYIIGEVIQAAIQPLIGVVDKAVNGLAYQAMSSILGTSGGSSAGSGFSMNVEDFKSHGQVMSQHAQTIAGHADDLKSTLSGMSFE